MRTQKLAALALQLALVVAAGAADLDHSKWNALLKEFVTPDSRVDYKDLKEHGSTYLDAYLTEVAKPWPEGMSLDETKAGLINSYNALAVRWILSNYPVDSIWRTNNPFLATRHNLDGGVTSLQQIEDRLRGMHDPRIHAALVCTARGCPPLRAEAYVATRLEDQLNDNVNRWLADPRLNEFLPESRTARVSQIFNWYAEDFDRIGGVREFLAQFAPVNDRAYLRRPDSKIQYQTYDWSLNDTSLHASGYSQVRFHLDRVRNAHLSGEIKRWFLGLGRKYGVDPIIFGTIYIGAIPFFSLSIGWLIRNLRQRRSPVLPAMCASFCFVSAYLYLLIAGKDIPTWVYLLVAAMIALGLYSTIRKIRTRLHERR